MKYILILLSISVMMVKNEEICQVLVAMLKLLPISHRVVLLKCLQNMNGIWKIFILICLNKSDVIFNQEFT